MQINAMESAVKYHPVKEAHPGLKKQSADTPKVVSEETAEETQPIENEEAATAENTETETPGVIRNLLAGHYKGVADVRLRINFAEEIDALNRTEANAIAEESSDSIAEELENGVQTLSGNPELSEEQLADIEETFGQFSESLNAAFTEYTSSSSAKSEELFDSVQGAYDEFKSALGSLWDEESPEPVDEGETDTVVGEDAGTVSGEGIAIENNEEAVTGEGDVEENPEADIRAEMQAFLDSFGNTFESWLADLQSSLESVSVLPEISEPRGNGVAFDKFMAIYNSLNESEEPLEEVMEP